MFGVNYFCRLTTTILAGFRSGRRSMWRVVTACGVFPGSGVVKRRHRPARGQPYPRALAMVAGMPRSRWLRVVSVFRPVCSMAGRIRPAIASSEPARAASHPKDRSGAEEARSALTRREQRLPLGLGCSTGGRGYEIAGACSPSTPMNRTVLEPVNDRLTGNRQRCKPPADEPERCLSRSTTGSPGTASRCSPGRATRTALEPVNDRLTGNRQPMQPRPSKPGRCLSRSTTGSPGTVSRCSPGRATRTALEPVNDRLTGNRQRCKPPR